MNNGLHTFEHLAPKNHMYAIQIVRNKLGLNSFDKFFRFQIEFRSKISKIFLFQVAAMGLPCLNVSSSSLPPLLPPVEGTDERSRTVLPIRHQSGMSMPRKYRLTNPIISFISYRQSKATSRLSKIFDEAVKVIPVLHLIKNRNLKLKRSDRKLGKDEEINKNNSLQSPG